MSIFTDNILNSFFFAVQRRGLSLVFLFRTIHREKNYIVNQRQERGKMTEEKGKGKRVKKSART